MYGEEPHKEPAWWEPWVVVVGLLAALMGLMCWILGPPNSKSELSHKDANKELTMQYAQAKCKEHNMDGLQYADIGNMIEGHRRGYEAVVWCINHETKATLREMIPIATD